MNYLHQLILIVTVLQLIVNVTQVVQVQLALSLHVQQSEVSLTTLLREGVSLNKLRITTLAVNYLRNCSKSRAAP